MQFCSDATGTSGHCQPIKFRKFKNARWQRRPFGKSENRNISTMDRPIWHGDMPRSSRPPQQIKFYAFKNLTWWPITIRKIKESRYLKNLLHLFQQNFSVLMHNGWPSLAFVL